MNYVYAALLLHSAGKKINEENLKKVVSAVDNPDEVKIKALVAALEGVDIRDVISKAAMPVATAVPTETKKEEKKEEVKAEEAEKKTEEATEALSALFG